MSVWTEGSGDRRGRANLRRRGMLKRFRSACLIASHRKNHRHFIGTSITRQSYYGRALRRSAGLTPRFNLRVATTSDFMVGRRFLAEISPTLADRVVKHNQREQTCRRPSRGQAGSSLIASVTPVSARCQASCQLGDRTVAALPSLGRLALLALPRYGLVVGNRTLMLAPNGLQRARADEQPSSTGGTVPASRSSVGWPVHRGRPHWFRIDDRRRHRHHRVACPAPFAKIFWFSFDANHLFILAIPAHTKGAFRDRHERRAGDAMDVGGAKDESAILRTVKSCGPDAPTLASSWRSDLRATVANKPGHRGEHEAAVKTIACGNAG
jgi:hypothetical protein